MTSLQYCSRYSKGSGDNTCKRPLTDVGYEMLITSMHSGNFSRMCLTNQIIRRPFEDVISLIPEKSFINNSPVSNSQTDNLSFFQLKNALYLDFVLCTRNFSSETTQVGELPRVGQLKALLKSMSKLFIKPQTDL